MTQRQKRKYDWTALKNEYVQSNVTMRELAAKYNIPLRSLTYHAVDKDNWFSAREEFRNRLAAESQRQTIEKAAAAISDERAQVIRIIDAVLAKGAEQLVGKRDESGAWITPPTMRVQARDLLDAGKLKLVLLGETIERSETRLSGDANNPLAVGFIEIVEHANDDGA